MYSSLNLVIAVSLADETKSEGALLRARQLTAPGRQLLALRKHFMCQSAG
jgi:hypothetical protein